MGNTVEVLDTAKLISGQSPLLTSYATGIAPEGMWVSPAAAPSVDLSVTMDGPAVAAPGQAITYTIKVALPPCATNPCTTPGPQVSMNLVDQLPPGTTFDPTIPITGCDYSLDPVTGYPVEKGCGQGGTFDAVTNTITAAGLVMNRAKNGDAYVLLYANVIAPSSTGTALTNTIDVDIDQNDPNLSNNHASWTTTTTTGLVIATQRPLPSGTLGTPYSLTLLTSGGVPSYTWSTTTPLNCVAACMLPPGLSLDPTTGTIGGTPAAVGTFTFGVQVTDGSSQTATATFSIWIAATPIPLPQTSTTLTSSPNPSVGGAAVTFTATVTATGVQPTGPVQLVDGTNVLATANLGPFLGGGLSPAVNYAAGTRPSGVAVGDFNGDGKADIVTANYYDTSVSTLLGNGDGTFQTHVESGTGDGLTPYSVAVADFNGDGKLDVAWVDAGVTMGVMLGNGDGTFGPSTDYSTGISSWPLALAVGDFNGDGKPDIAFIDYSNAWVGVFINNGNGTFIASPVTYTVGQWPYGIAIGDFNGDGKLDIVTANDSTAAGASVLLGNGDGTFQPKLDFNVGVGAYSVAVGDFNGDGKQDLALGWGYAYILLGNGNGTFTLAHSYYLPEQAWGIGVGDFNGDGKLDIVAGGTASGGMVTLLSGDGTGGFQQVDYPLAASPGLNAIAVGDFVNGGRPGVVTANEGSGANSVSVLLGTQFAQASFSISNLSAGSHSMTAVYAGNSNLAGSASAPLTQVVNAPVTIDHFGVTTSAGSIMAGVPFSVTVTAQDASNNPITSYSGTVHFSSTAAGAFLPPNYTFVVGDNGSHTFTNGVMLTVHGSQTINVNDVAQPSKTGSLGVFVLAPPACDPPPSGLVSWWPAEGNANDINGGNNGTLNGATFATGEVGQAFSFNGTGSYVDVPNSPTLNPTAAITIDAWINGASGRKEFEAIVKKEDSSQLNGYTLEVNTAGYLYFALYINNAWHSVATISPLAIRTWYQVAGTFDGSTMQLYVNGVAQGSGTAVTGSIGASSNHLNIGRDPANPTDSNRFWSGLIDEVHIYNRPLTATEIQAIYNAGASGLCLVPSPTLTSISPTSATAGAGAFTLNVTGTYFTNASTVLWNGSPRTTTYVSPTALQAAINANDIAGAGSASVSVQNPAPGGGLSSPLPFTISGPPLADLALNATTPPPTFNGYNITYSVTVTNGSTAYPNNVTATSVVVTDTLNRYTFVSASGPNGATDCGYNAGVVTCSIASLANQASATFTVTVAPSGSGWAWNLFHASADQLDPNPANNSVQIGPVVEGANTAVGANVAAFATDATTGASVAVTFSNVTASGNTTLTATSSGPAPAAGYRLGTPLLFYDLHTTATWSGTATLNLSYAGVAFHHPGKVRLFHQENGVWVDRTVGVDAAHSMISGVVGSFSLFAVLEPLNHAPLAGAATVVAPGVSASGAPVKLDGAASSDADGDTLSYRWTGPFAEGGGVATGASPTVTLPFGTSNLTLVVNDGEVNSTPVTVPVTVSDFTLAASGGASVQRGQSVSFVVAVSPRFGAFSAPVTLSCVNPPAGVSCVFSPATVAPGSNGASATLSVTTTTALAAAPRLRHGTPMALWLISLVPVGMVCIGARRKRRVMMVLGLGMLIAALHLGCGGGGGNSVTSTSTPPGPATTVTITISGASAGLQHSTTASFTAN